MQTGTVPVQAAGMDRTAAPAARDAAQHVSDEQTLRQYLSQAGARSLVLDADITLTKQLTVPAGVTVTLCGATGAETLTTAASWTDRDGMIEVAGELTLSDVIIDGGSRSRLVHVGKSGKFTVMEGSTLTSGSFSGVGAGVYNEGTMTMEGGSIIKNTTRTEGLGFGGGGGVYNAGSFTLNDGTVGANTAAGGGGIYSAGMLTVNGGTVTGNTAQIGTSSELYEVGKGCGGGVFVQSGTFTMNGGLISRNMANNNMTNHNYNNNHQVQNPGGIPMGCGGGVYVGNKGAVFTMEGGMITGNTAYGKAMETDTPRCGGGVYVQGGTDASKGKKAGVFCMYGGSITANKCQGLGGGVCLSPEEYAVVENGSGGGHSESVIPGAASMYIGGAAVISDNYIFRASGNEAHDLYVCKDIILHISRPFEAGADIHVNAEGSLTDGILADYDGVEPQASDPGIFTEAGARGIQLATNAEGAPCIAISLVDLSQGGTLSLAAQSYPYTGSPVKPEVTVKNADGAVLVLERDYVVTYEHNTSVPLKGTLPAVVVSGRGDYKGELRTTFTITPHDISGADSPVSIAGGALTDGTLSYDYDGNEHKPKLSSIVLTDEARGEKLYYNDDYTVEYKGDTVSPGTVTVTVKGIGNYTGSLSYQYTIVSTVPVIKSVENASGGVAVAWSAVKGASGYYVYRKSGSGGWKKIAAVKGASKTSYTDKEVKTNNGVAYSYTVAAYKGSKAGTYDKTGSSIIRLQATSIKKLAAKPAKSITVTWTQNKKASGYEIQYGTSKAFGGAKTVKAAKSKTVSKKISGLEPGKTYYVRVRGYSKLGKTTCYSAWSTVQNVKVK